jgi:glycosyltransferase involved in cell wall biosynthesis
MPERRRVSAGTAGRRKVIVSAFACHPPSTAGAGAEETILGSGESILGWNLVKQIARKNDVWVITQRRNRPGVLRAVANGEMAGVRFRFIDFPFWPSALWRRQITLHFYYYFWQVMAWRAARRLHANVRFDLAHHVTYASDWMPSFIGAFLPVPFVWGPVGGGQSTPKGFFRSYPLAGKMEEIERSLSQWTGRVLLLSRRRCAIKARAILVCNRDTRDRFPKKHLPKIKFFPVTGMEAEDAALPLEPREPGAPLRVLTSGRLVYWKNFGAAIEAFSRFSTGGPEARFNIVGEGPEAGRLRDLAERLGLRGKVSFTPWLPQKELWQAMRASDIFLYPSLREGGGAVVVEAMANGLPVICLDSAGPGFHVRDGWGIKVPPAGPETIVGGMADGLSRLAADPILRRDMSLAARKRAADFYVWDRLGERIEEIYGTAFEQERG